MNSTGTAKVCVKCRRDCANLPRRKNAQGRYICMECLAQLQPAPGHAPPAADEVFALEDDGPPPSRSARNAPPRLCAGCGTVMGPGAVICSRCGLSSSTGKYIGTGKGLGATGTCTECGYSLAGLTTPACPECGTVNSAQARRRAGSKGSYFREELLEPVIYLGVAALLSVLSLWGGPSHVQKSLLIGSAIMLPIGMVLYFLCGMMWIGFERPMKLTVLRLVTVFVFTDAVGLFAGGLVFFGFIRYGSMLIAMGYALYSLMDLDMADGVIVAALLMAATMAIHLTIVYSA